MADRWQSAEDEQALLERAQRGDLSALRTLYDHHAAPTWRLAHAAAGDVTVATDAVAGAFARVAGTQDRRAIDRFAPVRVQLLTAAHEGSIGSTEGTAARPRAGSTDAVLDAFDQLPERWRTVLWLRHVEGAAVRTTARVLGLAGSDAERLLRRASAGLHEQVLHQQATVVDQPRCHRTTLLLGGYVASSLPPRDSQRVRRHLDGCEACRSRLEELDDLGPHLRRSVPALPLTLWALVEDAWHQRTRAATGPFGLRLPGGRPLGAWAERALAGATAAVVAVGISAAVLTGGRRDAGGNGHAALATADDGLLGGAADGESALGGDVGGEAPASVDAATPDAPEREPAADAPRQGSTPSPPPAPAAGGASERPRLAPDSSAPAPAPAPSEPTPSPGPGPGPVPRPPAPPAPGTPTGPTPVEDLVATLDDVVDDVTEPLGLCVGLAPLQLSCGD